MSYETHGIWKESQKGYLKSVAVGVPSMGLLMLINYHALSIYYNWSFLLLYSFLPF